MGAGGVIVAANETAANRLGKGLDELIGSKMSELVPSEVFKRRKAYTDEAIRTRKAVHFEDMRDGRFLDNIIRPIINAAGKVSKLAVLSLDVTERKRAEETLRKSEQKYRLLVNQIPAILFKGYADWSMDFFDDKVEGLTGYPKEDFDSRTLKWTDLVVAEDQKEWKNKFLEALRTTRSYIREYRIRRKDGTLRWLQGRSQIFCDEAGRIDYVSGVLFDITEQRRTEEALRESEEKYRRLLETTNTGYVIVDSEGKVLDANPEYVRLAGHHELKEILGRSVIEWTMEQDRGKKAAGIEQCLKTGRRPAS